MILASPRDDRRVTIVDVGDRFCDHLLSSESVWIVCDLRRVAQKPDLAKTYLGHTFPSTKRLDSHELA